MKGFQRRKQSPRARKSLSKILGPNLINTLQLSFCRILSQLGARGSRGGCPKLRPTPRRSDPICFYMFWPSAAINVRGFTRALRCTLACVGAAQQRPILPGVKEHVCFKGL